MYMNSKTKRSILKVSDNKVKKCFRCDGNHVAKSCPFIYKECLYCLNERHRSKVSRKKVKANNKVKVNNVVQTKQSSTKEDDHEFYDIYSLSMSRNPALVLEANINGTDIKMKVDTRSLINMETYNTIKRKSDSLTYTKSKLRTYSRDVIKPEGMIEASFMM